MYTHMYKFKPFSILFDLEQLSAFVFGKQECRDMHIYMYLRLPNESIYVPVYMYMYVFKFSPKTRGHMKPKFMWNQNRIGEES